MVVFFYFFISILFINGVITDNNIEPNNALQKPSTTKPGAIFPANKNSNALITKLNNPNVIKFIGRDINSTNGFINKLITAITITTNNALTKLEIVIPGTIQAINEISNADNIHLIMMFILIPFFINTMVEFYKKKNAFYK
jgi:hypothetical protein